jgi:hypothetical protein
MRKIDDGGDLAEEGEEVEVLELDIDDAIAMIDRREIIDGKTVLLLQWVQLNDPERHLR